MEGNFGTTNKAMIGSLMNQWLGRLRAWHPEVIHGLGGGGAEAEQLTVEGIHGHEDHTTYVIGNGEGGREEGGMKVRLFHFKIQHKSNMVDVHESLEFHWAQRNALELASFYLHYNYTCI